MSQRTTTHSISEYTIGLDVGDRRSMGVGVDVEGEVMEEFKVATTQAGLRRSFEGRDACLVVIETGTQSPWISELLADLGHEVIVANPRRVRLISESDTKSDRADAESLARLGRADRKLLYPIRHRGRVAREHLAVLRARDAVVAARTQLVNHVRQQVKSFGERIPSCSTDSFHKKSIAAIPEALRPALAPVVEQIAALTKQIRHYDTDVMRLCDEVYPETATVRQICGVGPLTALCFILTLEDPGRFKRNRSVGPYLGLAPKQHQSGDQSPELRITKAGDAMLRRLLVGAAHSILGPFGPDTDLRRWGLQIAARGRKNAKKRAVVATARKLAVLMIALWQSGDLYDPERNLQAVSG